MDLTRNQVCNRFISNWNYSVQFLWYRNWKIYSSTLKSSYLKVFLLRTLFLKHHIYIYVFKYRQHFKAQTWRLLCNCRSLRGVCNIPLYSLELFYRLQKEYMVMFCCKISHWGHTVIHQACHWPLQCFCLYQQGCHMVVVIWYHWSIS
jgi:hypothetical protein